jgi:hypothetical protein
MKTRPQDHGRSFCCFCFQTPFALNRAALFGQPGLYARLRSSDSPKLVTWIRTPAAATGRAVTGDSPVTASQNMSTARDSQNMSTALLIDLPLLIDVPLVNAVFAFTQYNLYRVWKPGPNIQFLSGTTSRDAHRQDADGACAAARSDAGGADPGIQSEI